VNIASQRSANSGDGVSIGLDDLEGVAGLFCLRGAFCFLFAGPQAISRKGGDKTKDWLL